MATSFPWHRYPVLGFCGWSGSGKTTLLEALLRRPFYRGLRIAVAKHDAHGISVDHPGKDSDRLFNAGADISLAGPEQRLLRAGPQQAWEPIESSIVGLLQNHDMVLIEGHKGSPFPKLWLTAEDGSPPPAEVDTILEILPRDGQRLERADRFIQDWFPRAWSAPPLFGAVLIGGKSRRMGEPKHLITDGGLTWIERTVNTMEPQVDQVVLLGQQPVPEALAELPRLPDPPGVKGPLAGLLAALRWAPLCNWLVSPCDLPRLEPAALEWLASQAKTPGRWAIMPQLKPGRPEPLLAHYDFRSLPLLTALAHLGRAAPRALADFDVVAQPTIPAALAQCWENINTPQERHGSPK